MASPQPPEGDDSRWTVSLDDEVPGYVRLDLSSIDPEGVTATEVFMEPDEAEVMGRALVAFARQARAI